MFKYLLINAGTKLKVVPPLLFGAAITGYIVKKTSYIFTNNIEEMGGVSWMKLMMNKIIIF